MLELTHVSPSNFGRYALQNESSMEDSNDTTNERTQTRQKPILSNIPPLMSLSITPPVTMANTQQKSPTTPTSVIKENIEPLPFPLHSPGPIQRPNKLSCQPTAQSSFIFSDSTQSPMTPDVLVQINHLLDHQNSITTIPATPDVSMTTTTTSTTSSIQDMPTPNIPWTPFSPTEWTSKYDSSWPMPNIQSSTVPLTTQMKNPFAQQQASKEESPVWPTALGTATPRSTPLSIRTQQGSEWSELFPTTTPSTVEPTKPIDNSWSKFLPVSDSPMGDNLTSNRQENEENNAFWNPMTQATATTAWWSKTPSDENNDDKDHSRWDFAR